MSDDCGESKLPEVIWATDTPDRHWYEYECTCTEKYVRSDIADAEIADLNTRIVAWIETAATHAKAATKAESERDLLARYANWTNTHDSEHQFASEAIELARRIVRGG